MRQDNNQPLPTMEQVDGSDGRLTQAYVHYFLGREKLFNQLIEKVRLLQEEVQVLRHEVENGI